MKIAMFSPLPPKKTGIAMYTQNLLQHLNKIIDIDLYDADAGIETFLGNNVYDALMPSKLARLHLYDLIVYHLGNNSQFHLQIYQTLLHKPGVVILHDAILYFLIAGQDDYSFTRDFCINYGFDRIDEIAEIKRACHDNHLPSYSFPERYPLLKTITDSATAIIVHSETAKKIVISYGYAKDVYVVPFLIYEDALKCQISSIKKSEWRQKLSILDTDIIIGSFGFPAHTKRLETITAALTQIKSSLNFKFLIVGTNPDENLKKEIKKYNLDECIIFTGYLSSNDDFFDLMNLSDIIINLRYPSMGETSSIVIQAMSLAKPCIVTNHGWLSELPDNAVYKISYDETELMSLVNAILSLSKNTNLREDMGKNAKSYVNENCHPKKVSEKYYQILSTQARA